MLHNKHLREMIKEIDSSEDPGKLLTQAMQIPIFAEFVDECLRIVEPQDENKMEVWTPMIQWSLCLFWWCSLVYAVWHKNSCTSDTLLQLLNQLKRFWKPFTDNPLDWMNSHSSWTSQCLKSNLNFSFFFVQELSHYAFWGHFVLILVILLEND